LATKVSTEVDGRDHSGNCRFAMRCLVLASIRHASIPQRLYGGAVITIALLAVLAWVVHTSLTLVIEDAANVDHSAHETQAANAAGGDLRQAALLMEGMFLEQTATRATAIGKEALAAADQSARALEALGALAGTPAERARVEDLRAPVADLRAAMAQAVTLAGERLTIRSGEFFGAGPQAAEALRILSAVTNGDDGSPMLADKTARAVERFNDLRGGALRILIEEDYSVQGHMDAAARQALVLLGEIAIAGEMTDSIRTAAQQSTATVSNYVKVTGQLIAIARSLTELRTARIAPLQQSVNDGVQAVLTATAARHAERVQAIQQRAGHALDMTLGAAALIAAVLLLVSVLMSRSVAGPVIALTHAMNSLAAGNNEVDIPATGRKDEVGAMAASVLVFKHNARHMRELEDERIQEHEAAEAEKREALAQLADSFERSVGRMVGGMAAATEAMEREARSVTGITGDTSRLTAQAATATDSTASNVETVAAASEELASSIAEIARQTAESTAVAREVKALAGRADVKMVSLSEAVDKIGSVVQLITDIASQTNLLALNATIEAARAGEAGKGFAVVAGEVKVLASQTAKATDEIAGQIAAIQSVTGDAVDEIRRVAAAIEQVARIAGSIAAAVEEQGAATQEISRSVQHTSAGMQEVASTLAETADMAERGGQAASGLLATAGSLTGEAGNLSRSVADFLGRVRATNSQQGQGQQGQG
jgi:methyl-accepting chemotaxis protein